MELKSHSMIQPKFKQVQPQRAVNGTNFSSGDISLKWSVANGEYWVPNKSYIRMRCTVQKSVVAGGTTTIGPLEAKDNTSLNLNTASNLFRNMELRVNGTPVSRCIGFVPQVSVLRERMDKSQSWMSEVGSSLNNSFGSAEERKTTTIGTSKIELVFQPNALGLWNIGQGLTAMDCELVLTPVEQSKIATQALQMTGAVPAGTTISFSVDDFFLYLHTERGPRIDGDYVLDIEDYNCVSDVTQENLSSKQFTVSPSTDRLCVAFQDNRHESDALLSSSQFLGKSSEELKLSKIMVEYAGISQPQTDGSQNAGGTSNQAKSRYFETITTIGSLFDNGGAESYDNWLLYKGPYYAYDFIKDAEDRSTQVTLHTTFGTGLGDLRTLLFNNIRKAVLVTVQDGRTTEVLVQEK